MNRSIWVLSILLATAFLLGHWIPEFSATSNLYSSNQTVMASPQLYSFEPGEQQEIEALALEFTKRHYTYTLDNYLVEGQKLLPLLTQEYQETYSNSLERSYTAAKAVDAESTVANAIIMGLGKTAPDLCEIKLQFKAKVLTHDVETLNRYTTTLELKKVDENWRINEILEEQPVAFSNLEGLL